MWGGAAEARSPGLTACSEDDYNEPPASGCKRHDCTVHDIFISYRVRTERHVARTLALALEAAKRPERPVTVFLDSHCLLDGEPWEHAFLGGLRSSSLFVPLLSERSLLGIADNAARFQDNYLLEIEAALERESRGGMAILPLLVADWQSVGGRELLAPFAFPPLDRFPAAPHARSGPPPAPGATIRATIASLFRLQGVRCDPEDVAPVLTQIFRRLDRFRASSSSRGRGGSASPVDGLTPPPHEASTSLSGHRLADTVTRVRKLSAFIGGGSAPSLSTPPPPPPPLHPTSPTSSTPLKSPVPPSTTAAPHARRSPNPLQVLLDSLRSFQVTPILSMAEQPPSPVPMVKASGVTPPPPVPSRRPSSGRPSPPPPLQPPIAVVELGCDVQAAIDALPESGGIVHLASGLHRCVSPPLRLRRGVQLHGGGGATLRPASTEGSTSGPLISASGRGIALDGLVLRMLPGCAGGTIELLGGSLDCAHCDLSSPGAGPCVRASGGALQMVACRIHRCGGSGVEIGAGARWSADTCRLADNAGDGSVILPGGDATLDHCEIVGNTGWGVVLHAGSRLLLGAGNSFAANARGSVLDGRDRAGGTPPTASWQPLQRPAIALQRSRTAPVANAIQS